MPFKKGDKKPPTSGKTKGTENKVTQSARELFIKTLENQVPNIQAAFEEVKKDDPAVYLNLLAKYTQYFVPKMLDVTTRGEAINTIPISKWAEDDKKE